MKHSLFPPPMTRRNLNLPISAAHGLNATQLSDFAGWVAGHPFKGSLSPQQERWLIAESIDNCADVPTPDAPDCARATFEFWLAEGVESIPSAGVES